MLMQKTGLELRRGRIRTLSVQLLMACTCTFRGNGRDISNGFDFYNLFFGIMALFSHRSINDIIERQMKYKFCSVFSLH